MIDEQALLRLLHDIGSGRPEPAPDALPELAAARLSGDPNARPEDYFIDAIRLQLYRGDTALHVAAACYDEALAGALLAAGADVRARNRRGAEPLHAAVSGGPGAPTWDPVQQAVMVARLVAAGADPDAPAAGGVTPLHRAVRNRCAAAVEALLRAGADPERRSERGSTPADLARWTTGRGGSGSPAAKAEQQEIIRLLATAAR